MRNLNDFVRALGGIHNVLSGIAGKIDLIPVPGGGGSSIEWSTTETLTGEKYLGKDVYCIVIPGTGTGNSSTFDVSSLNLDDIIFGAVAFYQTSSGYEGTALWQTEIRAAAGVNTITVSTTGSAAADGRNLLLKYTKKASE